MIDLSVIIPVYNNLDKVLACLYSLQALSSKRYSVEYLVQDDASDEYCGPDVIPAIASTERNGENLGFPANVNKAATRAQGEWLFIVNQDVYAVPCWSSEWDVGLLNATKRRDVGVIGARLLYSCGLVQNAGGGFDARGQPYHKFLGVAWDSEEVAVEREVSWNTGAALCTSRSLWNCVGGFDPIYGRGYFEDVEFCLKVRNLGFKVWFTPKCTLIHTGASTGGSPHFLKNAQIFRDRWWGLLEPDCDEVKVGYW